MGHRPCVYRPVHGVWRAFAGPGVCWPGAVPAVGRGAIMAGRRVADPEMKRGVVWVRSRVVAITPARAAELLAANSTNRPVSKAVVRGFAEAMRRGEWMVTHQGIAFDTRGVLVDGQHRLAAIIEADRPVELTVFTEVGEGTFDVLDIGKRRSAADVLAIEGRSPQPCWRRWCARCGCMRTGRS